MGPGIELLKVAPTILGRCRGNQSGRPPDWAGLAHPHPCPRSPPPSQQSLGGGWAQLGSWAGTPPRVAASPAWLFQPWGGATLLTGVWDRPPQMQHSLNTGPLETSPSFKVWAQAPGLPAPCPVPALPSPQPQYPRGPLQSHCPAVSCSPHPLSQPSLQPPCCSPSDPPFLFCTPPPHWGLHGHPSPSALSWSAP